jgi:hypothetical protein
VPSWIRSRALAVHLLVFHGGMAAGSVLWGAVTQHAGIAVALFGAAGGLVVCLMAAARYPLEGSEQSNLNPLAHRRDSAAGRGYRRIQFGSRPSAHIQARRETTTRT